MEHAALDAAVRQMWHEEDVAARGLPESTIEVAFYEDTYYAVLKSRSKGKWVICPLPGLPKEVKFLVQTADEIVSFLVDEALKFPDAPRPRWWGDA